MLDTAADSPGAQVAPSVLGRLDDARALAELAAQVDVVTLEIENVAVAPLEALLERTTVYPPPRAVAAAQDRLAEKTLFRSLGIPTTRFVVVDGERDLGAARELGWPLVIKTRRMGYDGRGQRVVVVRGRAGGRVARARRCAVDRRAMGSVRARGLADRGPRRERRTRVLSARRECASRRHPGAHDRALCRRASPGACRAMARRAAERARLSRRAHGRVLSDRAADSSRTRWRRASTTPATGRSKAPRRASSRITCARWSAGRSARLALAGTRRC